MKEALLYKKLADKKVKCELCPHFCVIADGKRGICGVRENQDGVLYSLVYGKIVSAHADPIEKKPLFHFLPGTLSYSIATWAATFAVSFARTGRSPRCPGRSALLSVRIKHRMK
jgi:pyruvate formate lyase activating enzyme